MSLLAQIKLPTQRRSQLSAALFERLRALIYTETGIYFQDNKQYLLESRIGRRLRAIGLPDYETYCRKILDGALPREFNELINAVTINETFFFRAQSQVEVLEKQLLPELIEKRIQARNRRIRIWSAACSTGDEPYTIALMLRDRLMPRYPGVSFEIVGSDINSEVVETARAATYSSRAVQNVPPTILRKYFTQTGDRYTLVPEIRRMVTFRQHNLIEQRAAHAMRQFDLVLCANVLIYFDLDSKQQAVRSIYHSLNEGGYLLVGASETLYGITQAFHPIRLDRTVAYRKGE